MVGALVNHALTDGKPLDAVLELGQSDRTAAINDIAGLR